MTIDNKYLVEEIITELVASDNFFLNHKPELRKAVEEIIASRPEVKLDERFKESLRRKIMEKIIELNQKKVNLFNVNFMKKLFYALGGVALIIVIVFPFYFYKNKNTNQLALAPISIVKVGDGAFGSLVTASSNIKNTLESRSGIGLNFAGETGAVSGNDSGTKDASVTTQPPTAPMPTGTYPGAAPDKSVSLGMGMGGNSVMPDMPIRQTYYTFVYSGDDLDLSQTTVAVLKRVPNKLSSAGLLPVLSRFNLGVNLSKFNNANIQSLTLSEDRDLGYSIYFNMDEGSVSISENWPRWQTVAMSACRDEKCFVTNQLKIEDVPADEKLIELADEFIGNYGISLANYGRPEVQNEWRLYYENSVDKINYYVPESLSVVYPLVINNQNVYDESGNKVGLGVNINIRAMKVSGVWNLSTQTYQSSDYEAETDANKILDILKKGGLYGGYYPEAVGDQINIELGTPTMGYVKMYNYDNNTNQNSELLVPALIFPVNNTSGSINYYQKNIVIPLAKELLARNAIGPEPMPLILK